MSSLLIIPSPNRPTPADPQANILFLHGLGGDQKLTWTGKADAFWPGWLAEMFPDIAVFSLGYEASPSGWLGPTMPISDRATQLLALLEARHLLGTPMIFVVHSLGGLVVKEMIRIAETYQNKAWENVARETLGVVFLATPHTGSSVAGYLGALGTLLRLSVSVRELEANAAPLRALNLWYRNNVRRLAIQTRVFYESQQTNGVRVVDEASADPGIEGVIPIPVDANHISICKLDARDTLVFSSWAAILLDDANLKEAIPAALVLAFMNSGQACAAGTRLLVPSKQIDAVKRAIVEAMQAFPVGDPADPKIAVGPMVSQKQYDRVQSYIRKGIQEGAEVLIGGEGRPKGLEAGYFVKPTVFVNVSNDTTIAREEIFGPVLCVIAYDSDEDAIRIANDSNYGLHGAVLGTDLPRARRVASRLRAGRVVINGMTDDPQAPWGGFKFSGFGREYGAYGINAFLETRAILEAA
jgi:pimeloyl-ACP methyl ester carboxylesterase